MKKPIHLLVTEHFKSLTEDERNKYFKEKLLSLIMMQFEKENNSKGSDN